MNVGLRLDFFPIPLRNGDGHGVLQHRHAIICRFAGSVASRRSCDIFNNSQCHLAPRVGAAYRIGDKMVIRAGYGISTDPTNLFALSERRINFPYIESYVLDPPQTNAYITTLASGHHAASEPVPVCRLVVQSRCPAL